MSNDDNTNTHIDQMRVHLMATLASLRDRTNPMEPDRARAMAQVASVLVDSAKVEVDYLKATGQDCVSFLEQKPDDAPRITNNPSGYSQGTVTHLPGGVTRHTLKG